MKKKALFTGLLAALVLTCLAFGKSVLADTGLYRLYHPGLQVHLYTTDTNEYRVLASRGWNQEGLAWNTSDKQ
ncbi:TPA: glycosyhydrolase, partial [Streptococcus suis]